MNDQTESGQSANTTLTDQTSDEHTLPRTEDTSFGEPHDQETSEKVYPEEDNKRRGTYTNMVVEITRLCSERNYFLTGWEVSLRLAAHCRRSFKGQVLRSTTTLFIKLIIS
ncbi:hypothetical protein TNCV_4808581 [Trichonephila clavipes]|nr:hypothetical protein TNCV_4808581 [Trichonephila clavipes]